MRPGFREAQCSASSHRGIWGMWLFGWCICAPEYRHLVHVGVLSQLLWNGGYFSWGFMLHPSYSSSGNIYWVSASHRCTLCGGRESRTRKNYRQGDLPETRASLRCSQRKIGEWKVWWGLVKGGSGFLPQTLKKTTWSRGAVSIGEKANTTPLMLWKHGISLGY